MTELFDWFLLKTNQSLKKYSFLHGVGSWKFEMGKTYSVLRLEQHCSLHVFVSPSNFSEPSQGWSLTQGIFIQHLSPRCIVRSFVAHMHLIFKWCIQFWIMKSRSVTLLSLSLHPLFSGFLFWIISSEGYRSAPHYAGPWNHKAVLSSHYVRCCNISLSGAIKKKGHR